MFNHIPRLLKLAGPMILSSSAITVMQIIDALVLARHSSQAVAAIGPAGLAVILFQGFLFGTAGYAGTFVAHNHGRGDSRGVHVSAWLGIYTALASAFLALAIAWLFAKLFFLAGHEQLVARTKAPISASAWPVRFFRCWEQPWQAGFPVSAGPSSSPR